jgi:hypothetical protein
MAASKLGSRMKIVDGDEEKRSVGGRGKSWAGASNLFNPNETEIGASHLPLLLLRVHVTGPLALALRACQHSLSMFIPQETSSHQLEM